MQLKFWSFLSSQLKCLAISQLSVNFDISHSRLSVKIVVISQLSVKHHQDPQKIKWFPSHDSIGKRVKILS